MVQSQRIPYHPSYGRGHLRAWLIVIGVAIVAGYLAYAVREVLTPLLVSLALAYMLNPVVVWLERRKVPRLASVIGIFIGVVVAAMLFCWSILPKLIEQLGALIEWLGLKVPELIDWVEENHPELKTKFLSQLKQQAQSQSDDAILYIGNMLAAAVGSALVVINLVVLLPLYTFFFTWRFDAVVRFLEGCVPQMHRSTVMRVVRRIDEILSSFFRGRLLICLVVGAATALAYWIADVPYALVVGLTIGLLNIVPYMAPLIGVPLTIIACLLHGFDGWLVAKALIGYGVVQVLDNYLLTPWIQGKTMGLHPITIVVVLLIGGALGGFLGLLLAIPVAAIIKSLFVEFIWPEIQEVTGGQGASGADNSLPTDITETSTDEQYTDEE